MDLAEVLTSTLLDRYSVIKIVSIMFLSTCPFLTVFLVMTTVCQAAFAQDADSFGSWQFVEGDQGSDIMSAEPYTGRLLVVRCHQRETTVFVVWNEFVGATPRVEYRIDEQAPKEQIWNSSSDGGASFYPGRVIELLKWMEGHDRFTTKVTPRGKGPITAEFEITGIETALAPIKEKCRWK